MAAPWVDVSVPLRPGMLHWPGDPPLEIKRVSDLARGDPANVSRLILGVHSGTHVDAPVHFIEGAAGVDAIAPDRLIGPARVVELAAAPTIEPGDLRAIEPRAGERLLLRTRNSRRRWIDEAFDEGFVHLSTGAARFLAALPVGTVGIDYLSIGAASDGPATHRALLEGGVCIIEGLDLSAAPPGDYEMICLPLRLVGADGAPARVLLRPTARTS